MSDKPFGCLFERTEEHKNIAVSCLNELKTRLAKEGRAELINLIDYSLGQIKGI